MTANGVYSVLNVPRKATAFPLWRAIESRWNKNMDSLGSSITAVIRRPISWTNSMARWVHAPAVSITIGKKIWVFASSPYLAILLHLQQSIKNKDKDRAFKKQDKDKDYRLARIRMDKDIKLVLKESLRTMTRINITMLRYIFVFHFYIITNL